MEATASNATRVAKPKGFAWYLENGFSVLAAIIMLQTLFFKFSAAEESVYIFTKVGMEPVGRIGSGIAELIASVLILMPKTRWMGAILSIGVMAGAIVSHLTILGIDVLGDGGYLFFLALTVFVSASVVLVFRREDAFLFLAKILNRNQK